MTAEDLIAFEERMVALFEMGLIKAPLHLAGGNESQLLEIFKEIDVDRDWVLTSWRSHFHCLLKGVPPEKVEAAILDGKSISLCFPEHKIFSSGIVGGTSPIGLGIAMGLKMSGASWQHAAVRPPKVWVFIGDMTATSGIFNECLRYAMGQNLPIEFVVEDNGMSVSTPTAEAWGQNFDGRSRLRRYGYELTRSHVGIGRHVRF